MDKKRALFICVHNSARSQMAEAFLKQIAGDKFEVESAGLEPGKVNPIVIEAMKEIGIDISANKAKSVLGFIEQDKKFDYVITVCDESLGEKCPVFPGQGIKLHWSFEDPVSKEEPAEEKLIKTRIVRDQIKKKITEWLDEGRR